MNCNLGFVWVFVGIMKGNDKYKANFPGIVKFM